MKYNILIATYPFGLCGDKPVKLLEKTGWDLHYSFSGRRLQGNEVRDMLQDMDAVIAGTEPYDRETIEKADKLKVISRVGIGLDNIDFEACLKQGIKVANTPEAPSDAVADLTVAQIVNLLRSIHISNQSVKNGIWKRITGDSIRQIKIGILGVGRIGGRVINRLQPFGANIIACDTNDKVIDRYRVKQRYKDITWVDKDTLFKESDLISIHIPLNDKNYHFVGLSELSAMKKGSYLINTSRGSVVNEKDLESCLINKHLDGAALDVFEKEPYDGCMINMENVLLTAHLSSSDKLSRYLMELGAVENCIKLLNGEIPKDIVTEANFE
jgi:D-3-phosphoglycerate dehydrogenase / 2-oxoglutarate reductase